MPSGPVVFPGDHVDEVEAICCLIQHQEIHSEGCCSPLLFTLSKFIFYLNRAGNWAGIQSWTHLAFEYAWSSYSPQFVGGNKLAEIFWMTLSGGGMATASSGVYQEKLMTSQGKMSSLQAWSCPWWWGWHSKVNSNSSCLRTNMCME